MNKFYFIIILISASFTSYNYSSKNKTIKKIKEMEALCKANITVKSGDIFTFKDTIPLGYKISNLNISDNSIVKFLKLKRLKSGNKNIDHGQFKFTFKALKSGNVTIEIPKENPNSPHNLFIANISVE